MQIENILEDLNVDELPPGTEVLHALPRVRSLKPSARPHLWVLVNGVPLDDLVPTEVAAAMEVLRQNVGDSITGGPILTSDGSWVALANPSADTRAGRAAYIRSHIALARQLRSLPVRNIVIGAQRLPPRLVMAQVEGLRLGWYRLPLKLSPEPPDILVPGSDSAVVKALVQSELFSQATCLARFWTEQAPNRLTPEIFAEAARQLGQIVGLSVDVFEPEQMREAGMRGVLAVGEGSKNSARVVVLQHLSDERPAFGLVGKGITFDSGGISLKPSNNLRKLKGDKAGAAAILAASLAAAQMRVGTPFVAVLPLAENMPSATAYRPGDVVTMMDGTTVDIVSTDAEGRMVLADGMVLASSRGCERILTLATLTKASMIALGNFRAALYSSNDGLADDIVAAGEKVGEFVWRMPLDEDYALLLESPVADLLNSGQTGTGGSIIAAKFLQHFAQEVAWAHIDMSPIFFLDQQMPWGDKGYTGAGARLVLSLLASNDQLRD